MMASMRCSEIVSVPTRRTATAVPTMRRSPRRCARWRQHARATTVAAAPRAASSNSACHAPRDAYQPRSPEQAVEGRRAARIEGRAPLPASTASWSAPRLHQGDAGRPPAVAARRQARAAVPKARVPARRVGSSAMPRPLMPHTGVRADAVGVRGIEGGERMNIEWVYVAWAVATLAMFRLCKPAVAVLASYLGGWILLPVGVYPSGSVRRRVRLLDHRPGIAVGHGRDEGVGGRGQRAARRRRCSIATRSGACGRRGSTCRSSCGASGRGLASMFADASRPSAAPAAAYLVRRLGPALAAGPPLLLHPRRPAAPGQRPRGLGAGLPPLQPRRRHLRTPGLRLGVRPTSVPLRRGRPLCRLPAARLLRERQPVRAVDLALRAGRPVAGAGIAGGPHTVARRGRAPCSSPWRLPRSPSVPCCCWRSASPPCGRAAMSGRAG